MPVRIHTTEIDYYSLADSFVQRQSRSSRPAPRSTPAVQSRGAATMAAPPVAASRPMAPPATAAHVRLYHFLSPITNLLLLQPPAATSSGPGMLGQMAATAGSVAIGSTIGHGLSNMLFGSSSTSGGQAEPVQTQQQPLGSQCDFQVKGAYLSVCLSPYFGTLQSKTMNAGRRVEEYVTWHTPDRIFSEETRPASARPFLSVPASIRVIPRCSFRRPLPFLLTPTTVADQSFFHLRRVHKVPRDLGRQRVQLVPRAAQSRAYLFSPRAGIKLTRCTVPGNVRTASVITRFS